jgi:hypothetical protein
MATYPEVAQDPAPLFDGVRAITGRDPVVAMWEAIHDPTEQQRKKDMCERMNLVRDNARPVIEAEIGRRYQDAEQQARVMPFAGAGGANNMFRRIVRDIVRALFRTPPVRTVNDPADNLRYAELTDQMGEGGLTGKIRLGFEFMDAANVSYLLLRVSQRLGMLMDVLGADIVTVLSDPDDVTRMLGMAYESGYRIYNGQRCKVFRYWDALETFELFDNWPIMVPGTYEKHPFGEIPVVAIHAGERSCEYQDTTRGLSVLDAQKKIGAEGANLARLMKVHGHRQLNVSGELKDFNQNQVLDPQTVFITPPGVAVQAVDLTVDVVGNLAVIDHDMRTMAAHAGMSFDRILQKAPVASDDIGLMERREEMVPIAWRTEQRVFTLTKRLSLWHPNPALRMGAASKLFLEYPEVATRLDRMTELNIRELEKKALVRNDLDDIKEDRPEVRDDKSAWEVLKRNARIRAVAIMVKRILNISADGSTGQTPQQNGAQGPIARDGLQGAPPPQDMGITGDAVKQLDAVLSVLDKDFQ